MTPKFIVKIKPAGGIRFWCADRDGNAVHHYRQAAHFDSVEAARQFTIRMRALKPEAVYQIKPIP